MTLLDLGFSDIPKELTASLVMCVSMYFLYKEYKENKARINVLQDKLIQLETDTVKTFHAAITELNYTMVEVKNMLTQMNSHINQTAINNTKIDRYNELNTKTRTTKSKI